MPRKSPAKHDDPAESKRFIEAAREAQAEDGDDEALRRALKKVALSKRDEKPSSR
ncbi:MAG: hypothetical protein KGJ66_07565 [Alphaproteobacteria bacterium]|nr:hypothetical protein [Alphaproteobacteria bacterium]